MRTSDSTIASPTTEWRAATRSRPVVRDAADSLRHTLRANAATSVGGGLLMAFVPAWVDGLLGTGHPGWVRLIGIAVALFGVDVAILSTRPLDQLRRFTPPVIALDITWVMASVVAIVLGWFSPGGAVAVFAMAVAVDIFALLQFRSWRRMRAL